MREQPEATGLACHHYHDTFQTFPPAWCSKPGATNAAGNDYSLWGWGAFILPQVEETSLGDLLAVGVVHLQQAAATGTHTLVAMQKPIDVFRCPSDTAPPLNHVRALFPFGVASNALATSNYVASNSTFDISANPATIRQGAFIEDFGRRFRDIRDGTSNTFLLGERRWEIQRLNGAWNHVGAGVVFGIAARNYPGPRADVAACGRPRMNCNGVNDAGGNNWARRGFSSEHPQGALFACCDGSVHFVGESIEHDSSGNVYQRSDNNEIDTAYEQLISISDGNPVDVDSR